MVMVCSPHHCRYVVRKVHHMRYTKRAVRPDSHRLDRSGRLGPIVQRKCQSMHTDPWPLGAGICQETVRDALQSDGRERAHTGPTPGRQGYCSPGKPTTSMVRVRTPRRPPLFGDGTLCVGQLVSMESYCWKKGASIRESRTKRTLPPTSVARHCSQRVTMPPPHGRWVGGVRLRQGGQ
ncbi:uncharacterized protein TRAVEDRAFT_55448 [Trametes versicolor FP-101664 SS1]|uniref:uncharacterized protein n=1 Tax=Trametes versicolor (strain FP-101664) TaxID=717944 RepID=UPI00046243FB|nr:uncharacterized protein TRAVEDRAFT_55448 [Trametes versicolor FP-101664 SS1]EIW64542.1 hypothetical protein TRAVEDRAFT_55448 [Trametes versicolor FP-101664 SS1]